MREEQREKINEKKKVSALTDNITSFLQAYFHTKLDEQYATTKGILN